MNDWARIERPAFFEVAASADRKAASLSSAFQPVYSLSHGRLVGHEALLRVQNTADGHAVAPNVYFDSLHAKDERAAVDLASFRHHLRTYRLQGKALHSEWLFVNIHPASLQQRECDLQGFVEAIEASEVAPQRLVIEVLESPLETLEDLERSTSILRRMGCLVAIDDFGAGHSNFERVFQLSPHIVKLDRHVLLRAMQSAHACRIVQRMVSLLHECGSLVLMEGIETLDGAHVALNCDVDLVQGYFFARPDALGRDATDVCAPLEEAWRTFDVKQSGMDDRWRLRMTEQCEMLRLAAIALAGGDALPASCKRFLAMRGSSMCYLLSHEGRQIGEAAFAEGDSAAVLGRTTQFEPLHDCAGARWSRRPYFRRAVTFMNAVQLTRPYMTLQGGRMCFTASIAFELGDEVAILCGDIVVADSIVGA